MWTTREAMAFLNIGRSRLYDLIKQGTLPTYSIGTNGDYRFLVNDVKNLLIPLPGTGKIQF
jgi:excisionase family DNA binding protein